MKPLIYPNDRYNGYVALTDGNGEYYVPEFSRETQGLSEKQAALKYAGAFLILASRLNGRGDVYHTTDIGDTTLVIGTPEGKTPRGGE